MREPNPDHGHWPDERPRLPARGTGVAAAFLLAALGMCCTLCLGGLSAVPVMFLQHPDLLTSPGDLDPVTLTTAEVMAVSFFTGFGSFAVVGAGLALALRWRLTHALALRTPPLGPALIAVVAGFVVGLFPRWAATKLAEAFPALLDGGTLEIISRNLTEGPPHSVALLVFTVVVGAPIFEEICFRGLLWNAAERAAPGLWGQLGALAFTSLLFVLAHADPIQSPSLILTSLFLGWLRLTSGSLWPCVLFHFVNNAFAVALGMYAASVGGVTPSPIIAGLGLVATFALAGLLGLTRRRPLATPEAAWAEAR